MSAASGHRTTAPAGTAPDRSGGQGRTLRTAVENRLPVRLRRAQAFRAVHGRYPSLRSPRTFSEKMNWRILRDRRELLRDACDKLAMKERVRRSGAAVRVPEVLWSGADPGELLDVPLPEQWVLKPNHRANGLVLFGEGPVEDAADLRSRTRGWCRLGSHATTLGEWAYTQARRCLLVEERVPGDRQPADLKVLVFDGRPALVELHQDRFGAHRQLLFRPDGTPVGPSPAGGAAPEQLDDLLAAAARIADGFDFLRVDLYVADGQVWFGELTPYAGSGLAGALGPALERELGALWRLPDLRPAAGSQR